ncbi:DUF2955 domain-containing protein [Roseococcus sp. SYP-B2431]|uniref:DUF2955 domain-containing protein n=1 Tax=Roseococcus sp. SYP-B2431 TaxID=2496640 RepID=UPI00103C14F8|nr:DUF2955 domain-containing protein [Roseococcus sp. SYP-B2431]TCH98276.1 DUF2955 domain-containing protein [Roseococcus sp. SYP-B2431]
MSASAAAGLDQGEAGRRQALRIGLAVAFGMTAAVLSGSPLPFLAPVFAAQFLATSRAPLGLGQAAITTAFIAATGQALSLLAGLTGGNPGLFVLLLWLVYLGCFTAQARGKGGPLPMLLLTIGVIVPLADMLHGDLDRSMIAMLAVAVAAGAALSWAAHAVLPDPGGPAPAPPAIPADPGLGRPAVSAAILAGAVVLCLVEPRLHSAIVLPVTVATILARLEFARSLETAMGLVLVNIAGGVAASCAFAVIELRPDVPVLFLTLLGAGLLFGHGAAQPGKGAVYAGSLAIFLILLGLGLSPLPGSTADSFASRIAYVTAGAIGTLWACALLWPRPALSSHAKETPHGQP